MTLRIRLFAMMAQHAGHSTLDCDFPEGARAQDVQPELARRFPKLPWPPGTLIAINQDYADPTHPLHPGDEIAIIPPVSGG